MNVRHGAAVFAAACVGSAAIAVAGTSDEAALRVRPRLSDRVPMDAGVPDAGVPDASMPDAQPDGTVSDAGIPDAGPCARRATCGTCVAPGCVWCDSLAACVETNAACDSSRTWRGSQTPVSHESPRITEVSDCGVCASYRRCEACAAARGRPPLGPSIFEWCLSLDF